MKQEGRYANQIYMKKKPYAVSEICQTGHIIFPSGLKSESSQFKIACKSAITLGQMVANEVLRMRGNGIQRGNSQSRQYNLMKCQSYFTLL